MTAVCTLATETERLKSRGEQIKFSGSCKFKPLTCTVILDKQRH